MELAQRKLSQKEWESLEAPILGEELRILKMQFNKIILNDIKPETYQELENIKNGEIMLNRCKLDILEELHRMLILTN